MSSLVNMPVLAYFRNVITGWLAVQTQLEFNPWNSIKVGGREEPYPKRCPLTSTPILLCVHPHTIINILKINRKGCFKDS